MDVFLEVHDVVKQFAGYKALDSVSLEVARGSIFGLLGRNGAGKTTLIRIVNRITAPDSGRVVFDGHDMKPDDVLRIGYLPEERGLYRKMKVGEQAVYLSMLKGLGRKEAEKRLHVWFEKLGIESWWNRKLEELSKGMQQKVQFVVTVVHEPPLLIFDEPFSGFDPVNTEILKREMLELAAKGHTIIYSTHNMESVEEICDHFALIDHGRVKLSGNVDEVRHRLRKHVFALEYYGEVTLPTSDAFSVEQQAFSKGITRITVRKREGIGNSQLAAMLAQCGELLSFSEMLPSMNDIFISTVGTD
jgi:ABC-2 type transport system ATP-binding protein